jgi:sugar phosphate isomerase/epimerase
MDRRRFVHSFAVSLVGASALGRRSSSAAPLRRIGLELYSVRDAMRANPERTLAAVRAIGYTDVELLWSFGNFGRTPRQVHESLTHEGLRAPSAHIAPEILLADWDRSLADAKLLGHEYLIVPSLPAAADHSLDQWRLWADRFNTAGAAARRAGIWLAFHNEPDHVKPIDGVVPYDLFLQRTDASVVRQQLDLGNMVMGGGDPFDYLRRFGDRYWSFHVKDVVADRRHDTELGKGNVDVRRFLKSVQELSRKPVYVEQEGATDSLASAKANYSFLAALDV